MFDQAAPLRKIVIYLFIGLAVFFGVFFVFHIFTTGSVTVTTSSKSGYVSIKPLEQAAESKNIVSSKHSVSRRVKPGQYLISAVNGRTGPSASKVISVKARQSARYTLNPATPVSSEPIIPTNASSLAANAQQLYYVVSNRLDRLDASDNIQQGYGGLIGIKASAWESSNLAIFERTDNTIYQLRDGVVSQLPLPNPIPAAAHSNIALSKNGLLVFTNGGDVYAGILGQQYKLIYRSKDPEIKVSAGGNTVALVESPNPGRQGEGENRVTVIQSDGKKFVRELDALRAVLSPSGKHLFIAGEEGNYIYADSLQSKQNLVANPLGAYAWISDDKLSYGLGNILWTYIVSDRQSYELSNVGNTVQAITTSDDSSYLYVASSYLNKEGTGTISRVGLKHQQAPAYLQALGVLLPTDVGVCSLSYVNFYKLVITIHYPALETDASLCVKAAKGELRQAGNNNPEQFEYRVTALKAAAE